MTLIGVQDYTSFDNAYICPYHNDSENRTFFIFIQNVTAYLTLRPNKDAYGLKNCFYEGKIIQSGHLWDRTCQCISNLSNKT